MSEEGTRAADCPASPDPEGGPEGGSLGASRTSRFGPHGWAILGVVLVSLGLRVGLAEGQGIWVDEVFSLAMATGHSLEHPAEQANPAKGDYVESLWGADPAVYREYTEHGESFPSPLRVCRAVVLSDSSPPLYYLLLSGWTWVVGTSDMSLKAFSILFWLASLPFFCSLACKLGGRPAVLPSLVLFAASPYSIYYSTEGRMYSLMWFLAVLSAWLVVRVNERGRGVDLVYLLLAGVCGLLTHYFYAFVWLACGGWLLFSPGKSSRALSCLTASLTLALVTPWYRLLPENLASWRVTKGWLKMYDEGFAWPSALLNWVTSYLTPRMFSGGSGQEASRVVTALVLLGILGGVVARTRKTPIPPRARPLLLLALAWIVACLSGPFVLDLLRGTYMVRNPRYASAGLPAVLLLVGVGLAMLGPRLRAALLLGVVLSWAPGVTMLFQGVSHKEAWKELAAKTDELTGEKTVVVVHSIPSGVVNLARYMESDTPIVSWVGQLGQRTVPHDIARICREFDQVLFIKHFDVSSPSPEQDWLRDHFEETSEDVLYTQVSSFRAKDGGLLRSD